MDPLGVATSQESLYPEQPVLPSPVLEGCVVPFPILVLYDGVDLLPEQAAIDHLIAAEHSSPKGMDCSWGEPARPPPLSKVGTIRIGNMVPLLKDGQTLLNHGAFQHIVCIQGKDNITAISNEILYA